MNRTCFGVAAALGLLSSTSVPADAQTCGAIGFGHWQIDGPQRFRIDMDVTDLNGDGFLDFVSVHSFSAVFAANIIVQPGNGSSPGSRSFDPFVVADDDFARAGAGTLTSVATGDVDGDGVLDLVIGDAKAPEVPGPDSISVLRGNGDLTFQQELAFSTGGRFIRDVELADVDGDDDLDAVVALAGSDGVAVMLNDGAGRFTLAQSFASDASPYKIEFADLNCDGLEDFVIAAATDGPVDPDFLFAYINVGGGAFAEGGVILSSSGLANPDVFRGLTAADLDRDGLPDLVTGSPIGGSVTVLFNEGDGSFAAPILLSAGVGSKDVNDAVVGDFNGDYKPDLALAIDNDARLRIIPGNGDRTFRPATAPVRTDLNFNFDLFDDANQLFVADFDQNGSDDIVVLQGTDQFQWVALYNDCPGPAVPLDFDANEVFDFLDVAAYLIAADGAGLDADVDGDNDVDADDLRLFVVAIGAETGDLCRPFAWPTD